MVFVEESILSTLFWSFVLVRDILEKVKHFEFHKLCIFWNSVDINFLCQYTVYPVLFLILVNLYQWKCLFPNECLFYTRNHCKTEPHVMSVRGRLSVIPLRTKVFPEENGEDVVGRHCSLFVFSFLRKTKV